MEKLNPFTVFSIIIILILCAYILGWVIAELYNKYNDS